MVTMVSTHGWNLRLRLASLTFYIPAPEPSLPSSRSKDQRTNAQFHQMHAYELAANLKVLTSSPAIATSD